jgi:2-polyprenyl-6-hydroxyphenyl methylase/3-demethylubiquinone-9 3-methyltransferase
MPRGLERCGPERAGCSAAIAITAKSGADPLDHRAAAKRAFEAMMKMKKIDIATIEAARRGPARS